MITLMSLPRLLTLLAIPASVFAHPGGLDSKGGHNDRKNGGYHYHRTPPAPTPTAAKSTTGSAIVPTAPQSVPTVAAVETPERTAKQIYHAPSPRGSEGTGPAPTTASPLAKITIGMTKTQVETLIGKPNITLESSWLYTESGWVRFRGNTVFNIEAK